MDPRADPLPLNRRTLLLATLAAFVVALLGGLWLHSGSVLTDTDAYFHLAAARAYSADQVPEEFPPLRASAFTDGYGDKEWLFHRLLAVLVPADASAEVAVARGRVALALLGALAAAGMAALAVRLVGLWGALLPFLLFFTSQELAWRWVRLRPELLAFSLLLLFLWALAARRRWAVAGLAFLFTLAYTAFQVLGGLALLAVLALDGRQPLRRRPWALLIYTLLGIGTALVLHPHFPKNLEIWALQNLAFFQMKGSLAVGTEIQPQSTEVLLLANLGWWALLAVLTAAGGSAPRRRDGDLPRAATRDLAAVFVPAALVFFGMWLLMARFVLYAVPLVSLALLARLRSRARTPGPAVPLPAFVPRLRRVPTAVALGLCLLVALPGATQELARYRQRSSAGPEDLRLTDRAAFSRALPAGARVAADWGPTATYSLWAPQGRYLNALDPLFLAVPHPEKAEALDRVLTGREPDSPLALATLLESDHLAFPYPTAEPGLLARVQGDPRWQVLHSGIQTLLAVRPASDAFLLDWHLVPADASRPVPPAADLAAWPRWPRSPGEPGRRFEGWVDGDRVLGGQGDCLTLVTDLPAPGDSDEPAEPARWEIAPHGPTSLWLEGFGGLPGPLRIPATGSRLGQGVTVSLEEAARATVLTCCGEDGRLGFYFVRR